MLCSSCERPMRALFTSYACDFCDGLAEPDYVTGFIVLAEDRELAYSPFYVFRTRTDAAIWRSAQGLQHCPILEVLSEDRIRWKQSGGTIEGIELADRPFTIFGDHRFPPGPYRAFLSPQAQRAKAA